MKLSEALSAIAIVVAVASAAFSYVQVNAAKNQLRLAELHIRPYVKYTPIFSVEDTGGRVPSSGVGAVGK